MIFAANAQPQRLPPPTPTPGQVFSVPRLGGGYDYYQSKIPTPPLNDDYPLPNVAHPNEIGISSLAIGRPLPPDAVHVGSGLDAIGSLTPTPGSAPPLTTSVAGLGELTSSTMPWASYLLVAAAVAAGWWAYQKVTR